jgi:hypothetical protein
MFSFFQYNGSLRGVKRRTLYESMKPYEYEINTKEDEESHGDINLNDSDQVLAKKVAVRLQDGKSLHDKISRKAEENMALFDGDLEKVEMETLAKYNSKALKNVIFLTIRNLVGLSTDNPPIPDVAPAKETPQSKKRAKTVAGALQYGMLRTQFSDLLAECLFDTWIKRDSYLHWFWNYDKNDFDVVGVKIEEITFSPGATSIQDAEYLIYHPTRNRSWYKQNYKDFYEKIKFERVSDDGKIDNASSRGTSARMYCYWENDLNIEMVMGKDGNWIILKKRKNPYYEYRSTDEQIMQWASEMYPEAVMAAKQAQMPDATGVKAAMGLPEDADIEGFQPIINFLDKPRKPFVQIPSIKLMGELYSKDIISQIKAVFIDLNKKKRQIADNLRGCNTKLIVDSNAFSEDEVPSITDEPNQVILADFSTNPKPVYYAQPTGFELDKVLADMADDQQYIDDVFGHHEISRGAGNASTLGQDQMNFESDKTPVRFQVRAVEKAIVELWQGWIQLMKMFYTEVHYVKRFGANGAMEEYELMSKDIEEGIEPILRPMSTAPMSKVIRAQQATQLAVAGLLDPITMFEDLGRANAEELARRFTNWMKFQILSDEDPQQIEADMQDHANSEGDNTENPIERADQENRAMQGGSDVPPTPLELVTKEHIKLHIVFANDPKNKMEQDAKDNLLNHIEADKATLIELMKNGMLQEAQNGMTQEEEQPTPTDSTAA